MAEMVGTVAAGLGLAGIAVQIVNGIIKLRAFCERIEDAPVELAHMLASIEMSLRIIEQIRTVTPAEPHFRLAIEYACVCRQAVDDIVKVVDELSTGMPRERYWASFRMVVKGDRLQQMLLHLDRCLHHLHFAYYLAQTEDCRRVSRHLASMSLLPSDIPQQLYAGHSRAPEAPGVAGQQQAQHLGLTPVFAILDNVKPIEHAREPIKSTRRRLKMRTSVTKSMLHYIARCRERDWALLVQQAMNGWHVRLRCGRVLPNTSELWIPIINGDIPGVKRLLEAKKITMHDEDEDGATPFTILTPGDLPPFYTVDRRLDANGTFMQKVVKTCRARDSATDMLLDILQEPLPSWTDAQRFSVTWYSMFFHCDFDPIMDFMPELAAGKSRKYFDARGPDGASIFHLIAHHWGLSFLSNSPAKHEPIAARWAKLLTEGARSGADLHASWSFGHKKWQDLPSTPLVGFLGILVTDATINPPSEDSLTTHLQAWVSALYNTDIDLLKYGDVESPYIARTMQVMCSQTVLRITYGPSPYDWIVWTPDRGDVYAGVFWDLVERPERTAPCADDEVDLMDAVKKEDWYVNQILVRRQHSSREQRRKQRREQRRIKNVDGTSGVRGTGNPPLQLQGANEQVHGSTGYTSSHRPAFSFLHVDFDSKMIFCSLEASKISIRHAVLPQP